MGAFLLLAGTPGKRFALTELADPDPPAFDGRPFRVRRPISTSMRERDSPHSRNHQPADLQAHRASARTHRARCGTRLHHECSRRPRNTASSMKSSTGRAPDRSSCDGCVALGSRNKGVSIMKPRTGSDDTLRCSFLPQVAGRGGQADLFAKRLSARVYLRRMRGGLQLDP